MSAPGFDWEAVSPYLDELLELPDSERLGWLNRLRARDAALADRIGFLLEEHLCLKRENFLEGNPRMPSLERAAAGDIVGAYRLVSPLGRGGMGTVWLGERSDGRFDRRVAVKFLSVDLSGAEGETRFRREGSILGRLTHPHIAELIDAGVSAEGRPYLILEYVEGEHIDQYCDHRKLDVESRLRLVIDILSGLAHAHENLVVHRDIKPSNVIVRNDGQVKLLDFGIARLLETTKPSSTELLTSQEMRSALTPGFAAPEQITGGMLTTATDVYAMGVLLYVLLTGRHPVGAKQSVPTMLKAIVEAEPPAMTEAVAAAVSSEEMSQAPACRGTTPEALQRVLAGDLDSIVAKALKKDPRQRYSSVGALADDLQRYLTNRPVSARPMTVPYRASKFVRRNRAMVLLAGVASVALTLGVIGILVGAHTARVERDFALRQLARAEAINDLQNYVLSNAAPSGKPFTVNDLLTRAEHIVQQQKVDDATRVELLASIGSQYTVQDEYQKSRQLLQQAYQLSKTLPDPSIRAKVACKLGQVVSRMGDAAAGEALWHEGLNALPDSKLYALDRAGCWLRGSEIAVNEDRASDAITRALTARRILGQSQIHSEPEELESIIVLASAYNHPGTVGNAIAMYEEAAQQLKNVGRDDTQMAATMFNNWGATLLRVGRPVDAEAVLRRSIQISRDGAGEDAITSTTLGNYGYALYQLHRLDQAADYEEQAYLKATKSGDEMAANMALMHLARIRRDRGDLKGSDRLLSKLAARLPAGSLPFGVLTLELAQNAEAAGDLAQAEKLITKAVNIMEALAKAGRGSAEFEGRMLACRSDIEIQLGLPADALADAQRALAMVQQGAVPGGKSAFVGQSYLALGKALKGNGDSEQAQAAFRSAAANFQAALGSDHPETLLARQLAATIR